MSQVVLITGAAGFIGSHLSQRLLASGFKVIGLDNFDDFYGRSKKEMNLKVMQSHPEFRFIEGDIREDRTYDLLATCERPDAVVHLAALAGVQPSIRRPLDYWQVNVVGTERLFAGLRKLGGVKPVFLFASSSSVYGDSQTMPLLESSETDRPISPYAASKRSGELLCYTRFSLDAWRIACLRFFTVYGPRQRPDLAIRKFTERIIAGQSIDVYGDGTTFRDYTFVDDTVRGIELCLLKLLSMKSSFFDIFNIGYGNPLALESLLLLLEQTIGKKALINRMPEQPGDVRGTFASIEKLQKFIGFTPLVSHEEGLRRTVEWIIETSPRK